VLDFLNTRVEGVVRYFDGTPVAYPNVYLEQVDESGDTQYYYPDTTDQDGNYRITGLLQGAFTLYVNTNSGLNRTEFGTLSGASATVDVTLPEDMTVTGTVTDDGGAVVPLAQVRLETTFLWLFGTADANGVYRFEHMPVADGTVRATNPQSGKTGTAPLTGVALQTVVVDVVIPR
jgi:protocatechuate 3,4-dioxygenase beta subunit